MATVTHDPDFDLKFNLNKSSKRYIEQHEEIEQIVKLFNSKFGSNEALRAHQPVSAHYLPLKLRTTGFLFAHLVYLVQGDAIKMVDIRFTPLPSD